MVWLKKFFVKKILKRCSSCGAKLVSKYDGNKWEKYCYYCTETSKEKFEGKKVTRQDFIELCKSMPWIAKRKLVFNAYSENPMSLGICFVEVEQNTRLGKEVLRELGYEVVTWPGKKRTLL